MVRARIQTASKTRQRKKRRLGQVTDEALRFNLSRGGTQRVTTKGLFLRSVAVRTKLLADFPRHSHEKQTETHVVLGRGIHLAARPRLVPRGKRSWDAL